MTDRELMQQALDVLEDIFGKNKIDVGVINRLRDRLAQPEPRQWQGLTGAEIWKCNAAPSGSAVEYHICMLHQNVLDFAEAIEAKLKEKNA